MSDDTLPVGLMIIAFLVTFLAPVGGVSVQERLSAHGAVSPLMKTIVSHRRSLRHWSGVVL